MCDGPERIRVDAGTAKRALKRVFGHTRTVAAAPLLLGRNTLMRTLIGSSPPEIDARIARCAARRDPI